MHELPISHLSVCANKHKCGRKNAEIANDKFCTKQQRKYTADSGMRMGGKSGKAEGGGGKGWAMLRVLACYIDTLTAWWSKMSDKLTARSCLLNKAKMRIAPRCDPKKKTTTTVLQKHIHIYTRTRTHKYKWACKSGQLKVNKWVTFFRDPNQCQRVLPLGIHLLLGEKLTTKWFVNREISIIAPERNRII